MRESGFDLWQRLFPRERKSAPVTIVEIDERSLREFGQWPWPRAQLASLVEQIALHRPAAVGFDVLFPEPDRLSAVNDERFAASLEKVNAVLAAAGLEAPDSRFLAPPPSPPLRQAAPVELSLRSFQGHLGNVRDLAEAATGIGLISALPSSGLVRRAALFSEVQGVPVPALSLELWRVASGAPGFSLRQGDAGLLELAFAEARVPLRDDANMWLRYSRHDPGRFISAAEVLSGRAPPELLRDKLVLVGVTGLGLLDYKLTPLGEQVPGVELHAQLIEQIYDGEYLVRPVWTLWTELAFLALGTVLLVLRVPASRVSRSVGLFAALLVMAGIAAATAFRVNGVLLDPLWPALGLAGAFAVLLAGTLAEADRQRRELREAAARAAGELAAARRIQVGLLPDPKALFSGERRFQLRALVEPAQSVGGDFYDCFRLDDGRLFLVVADVSGKGMPAALFMALCKATLKAAAISESGDPGAALARAAAEITRDNPEAFFVTVFAGVLEPGGGLLRFCNAGHMAPFVRRPGEPLERFPPAGRPPIGVPDNFAFTTQSKQLLPGEWLCAVTDGVTEAMDANGKLYGAQRLEQVLRSLEPGADPEAIIAAVRRDVREFVGEARASDDLTLLVLSRPSER